MTAPTLRDQMSIFGQRLAAVETTLKHRGTTIDAIATQVSAIHDHMVASAALAKAKGNHSTKRHTFLTSTAQVFASVVTSLGAMYAIMHKITPQ